MTREQLVFEIRNFASKYLKTREKRIELYQNIIKDLQQEIKDELTAMGDQMKKSCEGAK